MTNQTDEKWIAACLRMARRHRGLTGTNPSVGTLLVKDNKVVGRGITAKGGRPHAEPIAIERAGQAARGATAYVTLEPCAHHGVTPPCAQALIDAGVSRVVTAWIDPDNRVDGKGHAMLEAAGIAVEEGVGSEVARRDLSFYLNRKLNNRPHVTLKLAVSADGKLGREGEETPITGTIAKNYGHRMRAEHDAILVGRGTVAADDPDLSCRLPGLAARSPKRYVLDTNASISPASRLVQSARDVPLAIISAKTKLPDAIANAGVQHLIAETHHGGLALPEILEDMASTGIMSVMVEGGAQTAGSFLEAGLVNEIALFTSHVQIGEGGIPSPLTPKTIPNGFSLARTLVLGDDTLEIFVKD